MKPLGFIIITYNRPADMLALLKNIAQLADVDALLEEVIVVNNASTSNYEEVKAYISANDHVPFRYFDAPENLGVARGRNFAVKKSTAPILIMLDDDAELGNHDALKNVLTSFEHKPVEDLGIRRETAIVSFKVLYFDTHAMQQNALPHKQYDRFKDKKSFYTYFYAGGAHAIKRHVLDEIGNYPEDFFYGMEEYDLAYRIIDKGYAIQYNDSIVMLHKESPLGRKPTSEKLKMMWVNKSKVAWRYLPGKYFYSTALLWSFQYLRVTGFNFRNFFRGWKAVAAIPRNEKRKTISKDALSYLKLVEARLSH